MIPKKLKRSGSSFVVNEQEKPVIMASAHLSDEDENNTLNEIVKRYNDYNLLKVYVIVLSISFILTQIALWMN